VNLDKRLLFPTPESPISTTVKQQTEKKYSIIINEKCLRGTTSEQSTI
jgi:hypothetical protein